MIVPHHCSLGNRARPCLKRKKKYEEKKAVRGNEGQKRYKTDRTQKMLKVSFFLSAITLNVNRLNSPVKRQLGRMDKTT